VGFGFVDSAIQWNLISQNGERKIELESFISLKQASVRGLLNLHTRMSKVHAGGWVRGWQRFSHMCGCF